MGVRAVHHIDVWVSDPDTSLGEWGWLLGEIAWEVDIEGASWVAEDGTYLFLERSCDQVDEPHDRLRPGINHLAFTVESRDLLDRIRAASTEHGWHELFADRYPHAGGEDVVALYVENSEGFEVELVVDVA